MLIRILKKDLKRKKTMNLILFLFLALATMFLAGSVRNMKSIGQSIEYFGKVTHVSDFFAITQNREEIEKFLKEKSYVEDYTISKMLVVDQDIFYNNGKKIEDSGSLMLCTVEHGYNKVLNQENQVIDSLNDGEIVLCYQLAEEKKIGIGDTISLAVNGITKEFKVKGFCKDMVFGSPYIGCKRLIISENEHRVLCESAQGQLAYMASIITDDTKQLNQDMTDEGLSVLFPFDYEKLCSVFIMDKLVMGIMIIMSMILIAISFVVLRFSILFTVQEEYKEIGVMKAVGLRQRSIRKVYLIKYIVLAVTGAVVGVIISFPFSHLLVSSLGKNIAVESGMGGWWLHVLCGMLVVLFVLGYCNLCTNRMKKISAMQAIRSGESGERYTRKSPVALHRRKSLPVRRYLAINDILSSPRKFFSMVITFALGIVMIILVDNASNTLSDTSIIRQMGYQKSDVVIDNGKLTTLVGRSVDAIQKEVDNLESLYQSKGIAVDLFEEYIVQGVVSSETNPEGLSANAYCVVNTDRSNYAYRKGMAPVLANECALTEKTMEALEVRIGDTVQLNCAGKIDSYLVTASYQSMLDAGYGMRLAPNAPSGNETASRVMEIQGNCEEGADVSRMILKMKEVTPDYNISNAKEFTKSQLGTVVTTLNSVTMLLMAIAVIINIAVAVLMEKTFFAKERSELALLLSLGISVRSLRRYHVERMLIVVVIGMALGILGSLLLDRPMVWATFGMMGAKDIRLVRAPFRVYLLYPVMLSLITSAAAYVSTSGMKKIKFCEINNME